MWKNSKPDSDSRDLNLSREYMQNIIQSMKGMLIVVNPEGRIETVNQATLRLLGYDDGELTGKRFNQTILGLPDTHDQDMMSATLLLSKHMIRDVEQTYIAKDGRRIPVLLSSDLIRDKDGLILGVVCVAHDETERHRVQQQIRHQANLMQAVSDAIIGVNLDFSINNWNQAAERIYGYALEEALDQDLNRLVRHHSGSTRLLKHGIEAVQPAWEPEQIHYRKDGSTLQILSAISLVYDAHNNPSGWVVVNRDITELKRTEAELERLVEQLALLRTIDAELGHSLDMNNVLLFSLRASINLSGASSGFIVMIDERNDCEIQLHNFDESKLNAENILAHPVVEWVRQTESALHLVEPEQMPEIAARMLPGSTAMIALPLIHQQRLIGVIELETTNARDFDDAMLDFLNMLVARVSVAVTNARLYRLSQGQLAELQMIYGHVSKLEQLKTDMIRIASHDLRSPIGLINGYIALLQSDLQNRVTEQEAEFLVEIMNASNRMDEITRDLLSLERIQQVAEEDYSEFVDLVPMVERAVKNYRRQAVLASQKLLYDANPALLAAYVQGDSAQIYEAISNLISNALKYTPDEGEICVKLWQEHDRIFFSVTDTGYGIPEEEQDKLFRPFSRAHTEETTRIKGTGLGLHLVNNIINRHDGKILFESEYQVGSTFGFSLPLVEDSVLETKS